MKPSKDLNLNLNSNAKMYHNNKIYIDNDNISDYPAFNKKDQL